ncbi:MAG: hypothetical protein ACRDFT_10170 [bacterium]
MKSTEYVDIHGRSFAVVIDGPDDAARYSATITERSTGRMLTRTPVRGRSVEDARERAADVIRNLTAIERLQAEAVAAITEFAPGAVIELTEDAGAIRADVSGGWRLALPLTLPREDITDPDADLEAWAKYVREFLAAYLRPVT